MDEVLSQSEVDALIAVYVATGGGESSASDEKEVRLYDFARPDKFSKERLKSLNIIHSKHGSAFAIAAATKLRAPVQVNRLPVDQLAYREYCASIPDGTLFVEVKLEPLTATAIFEFNPAIVSACVDLLAGGSSPSGTASELTEIDKVVMKPMVELALKKYTEAWSTCVPFKPQIVAMNIDTNSRQVLLPSEAVLVCGYEVAIGDCVSMMSICIPSAAVEAVFPALTVGRTLNTGGRRYDGDSLDALNKAFGGVSMQCHAVLGRTDLPLQEIMELEIGDVIRLPVKSNGVAEVWVGDVPVFAGVPGLAGRSLAIKIAKRLEDPLDD